MADGDRVDAGQTLIVLDDTAARARLDLLEGQHRSLVALNARLEAERDNQRAIRFPDWLAGAAVDDGEAAEVMATQERIFRARASVPSGRDDGCEGQADQHLREGSAAQEAERYG